MWLFTALLYIGAVPWYEVSQVSSKTERLTLAESVDLICGVVGAFGALRWKLSFILRNDDFESTLLVNGRRFRDFLPILLCSCPLQVMTVMLAATAPSWPVLLGYLFFIIYNSTTITSLLLYNDAMLNILQIEADLARSAKTLIDENEFIAKKWELRDRIKSVNELFAEPLMILYSQLPMMVLFTFCEVLGRSPELGELVVLIICMFSYLYQFLFLVRKGSDLNARTSILDMRLHLKIAMSDNGEDCVHLNSVIVQFCPRGELDSLRVICYTIDTANFMRYLLFCVTVVTILLQFDYKVVRYVNKLSSLQ